MTTALSSSRFGLPDLGIGVGMRVPHYTTIFAEKPTVDWFEIISENFMVEGGRPIANLERALESYRLVQHGVSMSIGSASPLDWEYLTKLKALVKRTGTPWLSDHLCWTGADEKNLHDLLPIPMTTEAARYVAERARIVQDFLEVRFALENVSSYLTYTSSVMTEWEFVSEVVERADIGLLFDVNNIYVSSQNHGFDPLDYIAGVPMDRVVQIHLAGHTKMEKYILDTHSGHVTDDVWKLYALTIEKAGRVPTLIEWDDAIPTFEILMAEVEKARNLREASLAKRRGASDGAELRA